MSKAKVKVVGEKVEIDKVDLSKLTVDCHGVEYTTEQDMVYVDIVRSYTMVDIFDLYHDDKKKISKIWVLGGRLNPKLSAPEVVLKEQKSG